MKLSEAILLGSIGSEQGRGYLSGFPTADKKCAIGAALFAQGVIVKDGAPILAAGRVWPWINTIVQPPIAWPITPITGSVQNIIWYLNDKGRWTRPQIAAWVAELEQVYDSQPEVIHEEVLCEVK